MFKVDLHIHTTNSDGLTKPEDVVKIAKRVGLSGVAVTDHNFLTNIKKDESILVILGEEITTKEGHILALGISEEIERDLPLEETIDRIKEQGALAVAAHPFDKFRKGVGDLVYKVDFDAIETLNARSIFPTFNSRARKAALKLKIPQVGGSDAHADDQIGRAYTIITKEVSNEDDVLKMIKKGYCYAEGKSIGVIKYLKEKTIKFLNSF